MTPDPEKQKAVEGAGQKAPEGASKEAGGESADAKKAREARRDLSDDAAKDTSEPKVERNEKLRNLAKDFPNNKWKEAYFQLVDQTEKHPELNGQFTDAVLAIMLFLAKYAHYMDRIPGVFGKSLDSDFKDEKLSEEEIATAVNQKKEAPKETLTEEQKEKFKAMGVEKASTSYVANKLFGMTDVDSPHCLAAKILHAKKTVETGEFDEDLEPEIEEILCYKSVNLEFLKENGMPFGTVLIFTPNEQKGEKITAYATGNGDEIEFIDGNGDITRANLNLNNKELALIPSQWDFQMALMPQFNSDPDYFAKHPNWVNNRLTEEKRFKEIEMQKEITSEDLKNLKNEISKNLGDTADFMNLEGAVFKGKITGLDFTKQKDAISAEVWEILGDKMTAVSSSGKLENLAKVVSDFVGFTVSPDEVGQFISEMYVSAILKAVEDNFKGTYPLFDKLQKKDSYKIKYEVKCSNDGFSFMTGFIVNNSFKTDYEAFKSK